MRTASARNSSVLGRAIIYLLCNNDMGSQGAAQNRDKSCIHARLRPILRNYLATLKGRKSHGAHL